MATTRISYEDKVGIVPKATHINQVWDDDMNELKTVVNNNADEHDALVTTVGAIDLSNFVDLSSNQTIAGDKTFTGTVLFPSLVATYVDLVTPQTISSVKTFTAQQIFDTGSTTYNIVSENDGSGIGIVANNTSIGAAMAIQNSGVGASQGIGLYVLNSGTGKGIRVQGAGSSQIVVEKAGGDNDFVVSGDGTLVTQSYIKSESYRVGTLNTAPASATDTGTLGEIRYTSDYIYVCTATNTWKRTALSTW